jgi:hypothetical protein
MFNWVPDIDNFWHWYSTRGIALTMALQAAWMTLPHDMKEQAPDWIVGVITLIILAGSLYGRAIDQSPLER